MLSIYIDIQRVKMFKQIAFFLGMMICLFMVLLSATDQMYGCQSLFATGLAGTLFFAMLLRNC